MEITSHPTICSFSITVLETRSRAFRAEKLPCRAFWSILVVLLSLQSSMRELWSVTSDKKGLTRFEQLRIDDLFVISQNTEHQLRMMDICFCCWCSLYAKLPPWFSVFGIIVLYRFFFRSDDTMKKSLLLCHWSSYSQKSLLISFGFNSYDTQFPYLWT